LIIAAAGQTLNTHYHHSNQLMVNVGCTVRQKNTLNVLPWVATFAVSEYTNRHNKVTGYIHWTECTHTGLQVAVRYSEYIPERAICHR